MFKIGKREKLSEMKILVFWGRFEAKG